MNEVVVKEEVVKQEDENQAAEEEQHAGGEEEADDEDEHEGEVNSDNKEGYRDDGGSMVLAPLLQPPIPAVEEPSFRSAGTSAQHGQRLHEVSFPFAHVMKPFSMDLAQQHPDIFDDCAVVVGMHPDQATEAIIDFALAAWDPPRRPLHRPAFYWAAAADHHHAARHEPPL